jgi:signal transduction histidine kinase
MVELMAIGVANARAYEQERQRAEALAELDRAKTAFFSNVSHEFRTPLQLVLGPLERVLQENGLGPERHHELLTARRNALRLLKLVTTLLDFSRLEAGRVQAVYQPTDLAALTSDIASMFRSAIDSAGAAVTPGWPDDPETVAEAREHPEVLAGKGISEIADYEAAIIRRLDRKSSAS